MWELAGELGLGGFMSLGVLKPKRYHSLALCLRAERRRWRLRGVESVSLLAAFLLALGAFGQA